MMREMKVLITGGSGFIGKPLVAELARENDVWLAGRHPTADTPGTHSVAWDLAGPPPVRAFPPRVDAVVHLAQSRDYRLFPDKAPEIARVNVGATLDLLDYASRSGVKKFVLASSGGVYGGADHPIEEDATVSAPDFYLATKLAAEALAHSYRSIFDVITLRLFFVYGRGQSPDRFFAKLVRRIIAGKPVILYGRDGIRLNPVHVLDVVDAVSSCLRLGGSHVVNIAGPEVITMRRLAETIGERVGRAPVFSEQPRDPQRDLVADTGLMQELLGAPSRRVSELVGEVCEEAMAAT